MVRKDVRVHDCDLHVVYVVCSRMIPEKRSPTSRNLGFFKVALQERGVLMQLRLTR
jgi:hypothetical protein